MSRARPRVVKVGGSLLEFDRLGPSLREWLAAEPAAATVLIAGCGGLADVIRRADAHHRLGEETSHRLCVRLLGVSARLLAGLLPEAEWLADFSLLRRRLSEPSPLLAVFDPEPFLVHDEPALPGCLLPRCWRATTDSIAARLAEALLADLVLLKSASPPPDLALAELAAEGYVDGHFPAAAANLNRVSLVNLRSLGERRVMREFRSTRA
jgi:aspartokinase-like uncharacterized kinase